MIAPQSGVCRRPSKPWLWLRQECGHCTCGPTAPPRPDVSHIRNLPDKKVVIVTVGRDFAEYLDEWISYYSLLGAHRIYVGLNDCGHELVKAKRRLHKYIHAGFVIYDPLAECENQLVLHKLLYKVGKMKAHHLDW